MSHPSDGKPTAPDAENAVLSRLLEQPDKFWPRATTDGLEVGFFATPCAAALWQLMADRRSRSLALDFVSVREAITGGKPENLTLTDLSRILMASGDSDTWDDHVEILRDRYARRVAIEAAADADSGQSALARLRNATERAASILSAQRHVLDAKTVVARFLAEMQDRNKSGDLPGLSTGIDAFDNASGGMRKGEMWVIGGKPSGGKSALMLQMAQKSIYTGRRVVVFSLEMTAQENCGRLVASMGGVSFASIMRPSQMTGWEMSKMKQILATLNESGLHVCDRGGMTIDEITAHALRLADSGDVDLVIVDYLQLVDVEYRKGQSRQEEVAKISRSCKQLAKRLKCPVVVVSRLDDEGKTRESRAIVQDADVVLMIGDGRIHVDKMRNGERDIAFPAFFDGLYQTFKIEPPEES